MCGAMCCASRKLFLLCGPRQPPQPHPGLHYRDRHALLRQLSPHAQELLRGMLRPDPEERFTASQVLGHAWLQDEAIASSPVAVSIGYLRDFHVRHVQQAAYKLLAKHDPDLGTVSFLIALVAAYRTADLATVQSSGRKGSGNVVQQMRCYLPAAAFVVAANYGLVLPFIIGRLPGAFVCYLGLGAATWLTLGIRAIRLFSSLEASAQARLLDEQEGMSEEG